MPRKAPFAFDGLDRLLHEKSRLSILTSLTDHPQGLSFTELRDLCGMTDGNLSRHVQILEEGGLVQVTKGFEGRRPLTTCQLTDEGRNRFADYLAVLEQVLRSARQAPDQNLSPKKGTA
ncbi:transcriptional regulator, ArsR family [Novosphingobium sp. CF614]|uniref:winged helix-turn-helix domain-containing protein n=1 Tax=Novosphingobium sp. CF614 TaxID=1884364 RepID=UPI0008E649C4|nr:transcriptional regulator [Novosphingobium sp. CF614]SFF78761.1 transcriptional regulator, ArsR family [Novosphingobium sp. CF614]